ncbi:MAG: hypothetical protein JW910_22340 [Anaerolineae bacterium]|nr:hypothetical protein [Anaerolineae bacterium]
MTKRQSSQQQSPPNLRLGGAAVVIIFLLVIVSQLTGIDLLGMLGLIDATPTMPPAVATQPGGVPATEIAGATSPFQVYFTAPTGSSDYATYVNGVDTIVAAAIDAATSTVDLAAFELNSQPIANALLNAHRRGVRVRIVTDDMHGLDVEMYYMYLDADEDEREDIADAMESPPDETLLDELYDAGIPIVDDDDEDLMHNKFIIIDGLDVWTGSMNLTVNGSYRNNNNFVRLRNRRIVEDYQAEFNEMFEQQLFGPRSPRNSPYPQVTINGVPVEVYFAPEDGVAEQVIEEINAAQSSIRFMAFSFTQDDIGNAVMARADAGVAVSGVFDVLNSGGERYNELYRFWCAGDRNMRWDGNPYILHHKVIIIDDATVLIGSFNFSNNATEDNDENLLIIHDPAIAARYVAEFNARYAEGTTPTGISCN